MFDAEKPSKDLLMEKRRWKTREVAVETIKRQEIEALLLLVGYCCSNLLLLLHWKMMQMLHL